jgi:YD repeat-containing protein
VASDSLYDAAGNRTVLRDGVFQTDPLDPDTIDRTGARETAFTYDLQGRQTGHTLPDDEGQPTETERTQYDDYGRTCRQVDFLGRVTTYEYDDGQGAGGRLVHVRYYASEADEAAETVARTVSYAYDAFGRQVEVDDTESGATQTSYDDLGRIAWVSSPQGVVNYAYDDVTGALARTWTSTVPGGSAETSVAYGYDPLGRLASVTMETRDGQSLANPEVTEYVYDIMGNLDQVLQSNGVITDYAYGMMDRLQSLTHYGPDGTPGDLSDNPVLERFEYTVDADGNRTSETQTDSQGHTNAYQWVYDAIGRMVRESLDAADRSLDYTADYAFDLVGNRLEKSTVPGSPQRSSARPSQPGAAALHRPRPKAGKDQGEHPSASSGQASTGKSTKTAKTGRTACRRRRSLSSCSFSCSP